MSYFLKFMSWLVVYSFFYFLSLDITGIPPGHESPGFNQIFNYGILLVISIPVWWFIWKKFEGRFGPKEPVILSDGSTEYLFSLRNIELNYYLMTLKPFLLAMGVNGIISYSYHEGGMKIFYICNFILLYLYAVPMLVIKTIKLKKSVSSKIILEDKKVVLKKDNEVISQISLNKIDGVKLEEPAMAMLIEGEGSKIYIGGPNAKGSSFYINGADAILEKIKGVKNIKIEKVDSIKEELKKVSFNPFI